MRGSLGHYRILRKLGAGAMGEVYLAADTRLERRVALKLLPPHVADDPICRKRLRREAEAVAALDHPNIVTIYSIDEAVGEQTGSEKVHFFTMQLIGGETLADAIPDRGFDVDRVLALALPLTDALGAAHGKGIAHRDLEPDLNESDGGRV